MLPPRPSPLAVAAAAAALLAGAGGLDDARAAGPCGPPVVNPVACENTRPGSPASEWDVGGGGPRASIQGFATEMSVAPGGVVSLKVATPATAWRADVYRLGWYGGLGARRVATVRPSVVLPQRQPACLRREATGLVDCGNWAVSAAWTVPATAVSGVYVAKLVREDGVASASHVVFVVRDDTGASDLLFQTSDTTWAAYNDYGGNSLYTGSNTTRPGDGRAYEVSYNRPLLTRDLAEGNRDNVFNAEYPMIRWLERNGYDVSYTSGIDTARRPAELREHRAFLSVGHDEYVSGGQRAAIEAARDAGVHLAYFSGNSTYWRTRFVPSMDASAQPYRTLVCWKETNAGRKIDPSPEWTGLWRDGRFGGGGGRAENALQGTIFGVIERYDAIRVRASDGRLRLWRHTALAGGVGGTLTAGSLGFEWDEDVDNGFRPAGLVSLSETIVAGVHHRRGLAWVDGPATHRLVLHRRPSGALVFGAGTIQWSWGLDATHDYPDRGGGADARIQQATVNLLADMGVQPATRQARLVATTASTDVTAPTAAITAVSPARTVAAGTVVTVSGTARDTGGQVGAVEVSADGGATWHPAAGRGTFTYRFAVPAGTHTVVARAADDSGNLGRAGAAVVVTGSP